MTEYSRRLSFGIPTSKYWLGGYHGNTFIQQFEALGGWVRQAYMFLIVNLTGLQAFTVLLQPHADFE